MNQNKKDDTVPTEILVKLSPEQIRFVAVKGESMREGTGNSTKPRTRWPALLNAIFSTLVGVTIWWVLFCVVTSGNVTTASQYLANLAAGAVLYGSLAGLMRALHSAFDDMGFAVSAGMLAAIGGLWVAIVGLVEINVLGTNAISSNL